MSGGGMDITFSKNNDKISSILWVGYPGQAGDAAIADVIFGAYNPSGRLPMTWYPQAYVDMVPMTNMNMRPDPTTGYRGRSYRFYKGETVFSCGDGLSYSDFTHHLVKAPNQVSIALQENHVCHSSTCKSVDALGDHCTDLGFEVHLKVKNNGNMEGVDHPYKRMSQKYLGLLGERLFSVSLKKFLICSFPSIPKALFLFFFFFWWLIIIWRLKSMVVLV